ncbi:MULTISPECIES: LPS export ABC transporter permease LptG [Edaphosphingomonas]|uniref:Lipopolysaccharide export system permease protein LptG n=1 Tax=Edaphosphingomonas haloaromaticamans TaxID=653954 RepID=A0A1S1HH28_9SPHN|nr:MULTISPECIES: LPS export ABC transporter permease LptG [Sphingomonas]OHT21377.1 Lipopolysaccharide export system permease protein LptG [Sphingomonas haloaromaticamans]
MKALLGRFFASPTLTWYMGKKFVLTSFGVLAALVLILQTLDLLGESGNILAYPGNGQAELWQYVSLRMPQLIARFLPFAVLLGALITFVTLNQNSEIIAMKSAGVSAHQILTPLIVASIGIAALSFAFNERIVARATGTLNAWEAAEYGPIPKDRGIVSNVWVRAGDDLIHADQASGRGAGVKLANVTVYDRIGGTLETIISAESGRYDRGGWLLEKVRRFDVTRGVASDLPSLTVARGVAPDRFTLSNVNADERNFLDLRTAIADLQAAGRPTEALEAGLWHKISGPISSVLMPLLAGVAAFGLARSGRLFIRAVIGMALGFTYFVADNFGLAMGNIGAYPPLLAAWGPPILFLLIGETVLIRTEE